MNARHSQTAIFSSRTVSSLFRQILTITEEGCVAVKTVAKGIFKDYGSTIDDYVHVLSRMNAMFVNSATVDIQVAVHRVQNTVSDIGTTLI